jgi:hypothetical protein
MRSTTRTIACIVLTMLLSLSAAFTQNTGSRPVIHVGSFDSGLSIAHAVETAEKAMRDAVGCSDKAAIYANGHRQYMRSSPLLPSDRICRDPK